MKELLNYNWEKYVGRRQPPLRGELALRGTLDWLDSHSFAGDNSKLYIFFSNLTGKGIISDHYINNDLRKSIVGEFKIRIKKNFGVVDEYLLDFEDKTEELKVFSAKFASITDFSQHNLLELFAEFCRVWEDFGPNLYVFLLLIEACEDLVLDDFTNDPEARSKLMSQVGAGVESEFFATEKTGVSAVPNYFSEKYDIYIEKLRELAEYRDKRKVVYDDGWYKYCSAFLKEVESKCGLGEKFYFLSKKQIFDIMGGRSGLRDIELPALVYADKGEVLFACGDVVRGLKEVIVKKTTGEEIKGTVACRGLAVGKVRLIEPHVENQKFEDGEVLVTRMTTPDLMAIIKRACAIVTDEGGVTCHAAIVSRELNKPCIIGTKVASDVFKEGDIVEVDAEKGIVRKIKSA